MTDKRVKMRTGQDVQMSPAIDMRAHGISPEICSFATSCRKQSIISGARMQTNRMMV